MKQAQTPSPTDFADPLPLAPGRGPQSEVHRLAPIRSRFSRKQPARTENGYWRAGRRSTIDCGNTAPSLLEASSSPCHPWRHRRRSALHCHISLSTLWWTLTSHLNDKQSPFRKLVEDYAPALATAAGQSKRGKEFATQLGFYNLAKAPLVVPAPKEVHDKRRHSPAVGTAFDIRTRMMLDQFEPCYSASALGIRAFSFWYARLMKDGELIAEMLADSFREAENLMIQGTEEDKDRASIIFTWCEALYRAGLRALFSSLGERLHASKTVDDLFASIPPAMIADVSNLRAANQTQIEEWRTMIRRGVSYTENPHFSGGSLVGGADGDWFIDDTLFDCKVKDTITAPWVRKALMQLLGYLILDLDNDYQTKRIGIWLPRQATVRTWEIEEILGSDTEAVLATARLDVQSVMERGMGVVA